jgi:hydroxymethylglutaryl-CoA lyase
MAELVRIVEVGGRDGLQNEAQILPVETRVDLIQRLVAAGLRTVEAGAFVSPTWVPQMADTAAVLDGLTDAQGANPELSLPVLVPNMQGYQRAATTEADTIAIFAAASETFSNKNINVGIEESLERYRPVAAAALADGRRVRGYVSCVVGCPYEGEVAVDSVRRVALELLDMGCYEVSLGDTIGVGAAGQVRRLIRSLAADVPVSMLAGHFHDTYGQGVANVAAAVEEGVRVFDASVSGLGGCPYAEGASGNVATEDVVYLLEQSGFDTGVDLDALIDVSRWISSTLGRDVGSKVARARS